MNMPLKIRPVRLKQSIYFRVPSDIADLIGIDPEEQVILKLEEQNDQYLLIYSVKKPPTSTTAHPPLSSIADAEKAAHQLAPNARSLTFG
jgi:hypothetical protein